MTVPSAQPRRRLPAAERRAAIEQAATMCFAERGYGGTTTAMIAAAAGCNETLLFRHFGSKRGLFLACIDAAWTTVRAACDEAMAAEREEALHWQRMGSTFLQLTEREPAPARLWVRALTETTGDAEIDAHLSGLMRDVHAYAAGVLERSQAAGGVLPQRRPFAEAWIVIALALLGTVGQRLGGEVASGFADALTSHRSWLTGGDTEG